MSDTSSIDEEHYEETIEEDWYFSIVWRLNW